MQIYKVSSASETGELATSNPCFPRRFLVHVTLSPVDFYGIPAFGEQCVGFSLQWGSRITRFTMPVWLTAPDEPSEHFYNELAVSASHVVTLLAGDNSLTYGAAPTGLLPGETLTYQLDISVQELPLV